MGIFIAIEGGDGSGKATQAGLLEEYLKAQGRPVFRVSFPRYDEDSAIYASRYLNGEYGEDPNAIHPDLASLPYAIDRFAAKPDIEAALAQPDGVVIADRYVASNLAHQGTKFDSADARHQFYDEDKHLEFDILGIPRPDLSIVLIVPTDIAQANVDKKQTRSYTDRKRDIHEGNSDHLERAKANYEELCKLYPTEFTAIQCTQDGAMRSIEAIQEDIREKAGL
jgi:dTMP kinase